jgi:hypothetical protein
MPFPSLFLPRISHDAPKGFEGEGHLTLFFLHPLVIAQSTSLTLPRRSLIAQMECHPLTIHREHFLHLFNSDMPSTPSAVLLPFTNLYPFQHTSQLK